MNLEEVVIVSANRTAIGRFGGSLKDISAVDMTSQLLQKMLDNINLDSSLVDEVFMGNVLSAGLGQNVARQIAIQSGISFKTPATTINQVCGSGMKAVMLASQSIMTGENEIVVAGGCENMSQAPHILSNHRWGFKLGNDSVVDTLVYDGLTDAFEGYHMGVTAENLAEKYQISREEQDVFALNSQKKAEKAFSSGRFKQEIIPIVQTKRGQEVIFAEDENIRMGQTLTDLEKLKPVFKKKGTVTAGNSSTINDGAAVLILMSKRKAEELGLEAMVSIRSMGKAGVEPALMGTGPIPASQNALKNAGLTIEDMDLIESNEAFAVQSLVVNQELGIKDEIINVNGGAIALGHPIGCSGARILVTLIHEMKARNVERGLATLCIGGGQGDAVIVERARA
ncbi:acetyl-CoA C-acetyltransferase [Facklamia sp. 7083-14-GEN3]|uniref:acetyl-CoA C-acetyltransferase n=1 Tax=Facklamia sp. 7083-14-GEN3 TaxID=2973478 RepID=UPI00215B9C0C|nr:acetyl-CoA C-acetyltransferase [Facklamia sp. 7083-14-GEN3]MCR8969859.1 acetyl-CoA C-acetyltransferase [Facklamia sp. 7083-14-GEN3]